MQSIKKERKIFRIVIFSILPGMKDNYYEFFLTVGVRTAALPGSVGIFIMTLTRTTHMLVFSSHFHLARDACQFVQSFHFLSSMRCGCHICCCHPMMFRSRISHQTQNDLWGGADAGRYTSFEAKRSTGDWLTVTQNHRQCRHRNATKKKS